jgi:hypothetical protein
MPRAYDLVGTITMPVEVFPRIAALEKMATSLRARGLDEAADDTLELLSEARAFQASMHARASRLRRLWSAVEVADQPQTPATQQQATRALVAASLHYRSIREQGSRRP